MIAGSNKLCKWKQQWEEEGKLTRGEATTKFASQCSGINELCTAKSLESASSQARQPFSPLIAMRCDERIMLSSHARLEQIMALENAMEKWISLSARAVVKLFHSPRERHLKNNKRTKTENNRNCEENNRSGADKETLERKYQHGQCQ